VAPSRRRRAVDGERGRAQLLDARLHPLMRRSSVGIDGAPLMRAFVQRRRRRGTRGQHSIESREERRRSRVSFALIFFCIFVPFVPHSFDSLGLFMGRWINMDLANRHYSAHHIYSIPYRPDHILPSCLENKA
jgi:hypothetical protein